MTQSLLVEDFKYGGAAAEPEVCISLNAGSGGHFAYASPTAAPLYFHQPGGSTGAGGGDVRQFSYLL